MAGDNSGLQNENRGVYWCAGSAAQQAKYRPTGTTNQGAEGHKTSKGLSPDGLADALALGGNLLLLSAHLS